MCMLRPMRCFAGLHGFVYILHRDLANATIWGLHTPAGGYEPKIRTGPRFLYDAPTPKFHHPMFTRSEVIVLTNKPTHPRTHKQTDIGKNIQHSLLRYDVG